MNKVTVDYTHHDIIVVFFNSDKVELGDVMWSIMEHAVAQLVEALRYKPEGRGVDSRWCHWNFKLT